MFVILEEAAKRACIGDLTTVNITITYPELVEEGVEPMFQTIKEKILVSGTYQRAKFIPNAFIWQHQRYPVDKITLISDLNQGQKKRRMYSLLSKNRLHRVVFDRDEETWTLEEVWHE